MMSQVRPQSSGIVDADRGVRVFVSSTFRDMHAERDRMARHVFPRLRWVCEQRGVGWADVDLRWGITRQEAEQGRVLTICLDEIENCGPMLVMLGERYGWIPPELMPDWTERRPWLTGCVGLSVTEIEILHGALNEPRASRRPVFFYLRDPGYLDRLPDGSDPEEFQPEEDNARHRLADLKARIQASGYPVRGPYRDVGELGELVLADLSSWLDQAYPEKQPPGPLDREREAQQAYAEARLRGCVERPALLARLDRHAASVGPPLAVIGSPGSGKSTLLASWAERARTGRAQVPGLLDRLGGWLRGRGSRKAVGNTETLPLVLTHHIG